ncbi:MAG: hypothetical protein JXR40_11390 [Pontiellaceae bacterium]|nr:hypothetical protein [Pontiellaceae bacterium]
MLRGIRIFAIFGFAILVGYAAGELRGTPTHEQKTRLIALTLASAMALVVLGVIEAKQLKQPNKKSHRFGSTHRTSRTAVQAGEAGYSSFYSARPNEEAWRVRKQHSSSNQRRSKPRK